MVPGLPFGYTRRSLGIDLSAILAGLVLIGAFGWLLWSAGRRLDAALTAPPPELGAFDRMTTASEPPETTP